MFGGRVCPVTQVITCWRKSDVHPDGLSNQGMFDFTSSGCPPACSTLVDVAVADASGCCLMELPEELQSLHVQGCFVQAAYLLASECCIWKTASGQTA